MIEKPTVPQPAEPFDPIRDLSNRMAKVEVSQMKLSDGLSDLRTQIMQFQLNVNQTTHDIASATVESLDRALIEIHEKRKEIARRKLQTTDPNELFQLEMWDDNLDQREKRTTIDRDREVIKRERSNASVEDTQNKIQNMRPGDRTLAFAPIPAAAPEPSVPDKIAKFLGDKILPDLVKMLIYFILAAVGYYIVGKINGTIP